MVTRSHLIIALFEDCPPDLCHQKIFGKIVELMIMNEVYGAECEPTCAEVKELFFHEYNKALR
jgi:hypothetical protein